MQSDIILQSTSTIIVLKLYLTDHVTLATGKTLAITISKNAGAFANPSGGATNATEIANGWYYVTLSTTDTGTLGPIIVLGIASGCDNADQSFTVVKATNRGMTGIPDAVAAASGGLLTVGTGSGQITPDGTGSVPIAFGTVLPVAPVANSVGEALFASDIQLGRINTAQAGAASTITLDAGASAVTNSYVGDGIYLYGGTGGGIRGTGQFRTITAYDPSTKIATVNRAWGTTPDNTTKFMTLPIAMADVGLWSLSAVATPNVAGVPLIDVGYTKGTVSTGVAGYMGVDWSHVNAPTTTVGLTGTTISSSQVVASVTGATGSVTAGVTVTTNNDKTGYSLTQAFPANFAALGISAGGKINGVVLVDTLTTYTGNTLQTGDNFARLGAPAGASLSADIASVKTSVGAVTGAVGSVTGAVGSVTGNVGGNVTGSVGSVVGAVGSVTGAVGSVTGSVGSVTAAVTILLTPVLGTPRDITAIADGSITINDALWAAIGCGVGKEDVAGLSSYTVKTPSTGTLLRTFTIDSLTAPTYRH